MASIFAWGQWLSRDEFVDLRNRQDDQLNMVFAGFRESVQFLREEVYGNMQEIMYGNMQEIKNTVHDLRADINKTNTDLTQLKTDVCELRAEVGQTQAFMRNSALRNPNAPIRPPPVYRPGQGVVFPNRKLFPRNANQFYQLRDPLTPQRREMLAYLVEFYDLRNADYCEEPAGNDDQNENDTEDPDEIFLRLETLLGLNEEKFIKFRQKAAEMASRQPERPAKRAQAAHVNAEPLARRPKLTLDELMERQPPPAARSRLDMGRFEWRTRSTPPSQRLTINQLNQRLPKQVTPEREQEYSKDGTDSDDATRPFTSPREP
ncbi:hypothetical protein GCG54_00015249 [Colletotrichum gloeosporioides]|uniref:Uncharacterized protein n=1 Tax=Colletotrichum gloeosporioides TaxID=474922 RepID=A0A8H4FE57_COLGL|nr:uncharacterized protein GCG54_00015249 [Colletotrichum gloeosporioides]KAF3798545.1 hypothetical protein GCG54_00015249 [Colletotrichum gloeosporioides]